MGEALLQLANTPHMLEMVAGVVFVAGLFTLFLCWLLFSLRTRRHRKFLESWSAEAPRDETKTRAAKIRFDWYQWVTESYFAGHDDDETEVSIDDSADPSHVRNHVVEELDKYLEEDTRYQFLNNSSTLAPVLGVILTAIGFFLYAGKSQTSEAFTLGAMLPLAAGLFVGAMLAFFGFGFAMLANASRIRMSQAGRRWFDTYWRHCQQQMTAHVPTTDVGMATESIDQLLKPVQEAASKAIAVINESQKRLTQSDASSQQLLANTAKLAEQLLDRNDKIDHAMTSVAETFASIEDSISKSTETLDKKHEELAAAETAIPEILESLKAGVAGLNEGVDNLKVAGKAAAEGSTTFKEGADALHTTLQDDLTPAANKLREFSKHGGEVVEKVNEIAEAGVVAMNSLTETTAQLLGAAGTTGAAALKLNTTVEDELVPAAEMQSEASEQCANAASTLGDSVTSLNNNVVLFEESVNEHVKFGKTIATAVEEDLVPGITAFTDSTQSLEKHLESTADSAQTFNKQTAELVSAMNEASNNVKVTAASMAELLSSEFPDAAKKLRQAGEDAEALGETVGGITDSLRESQDALSELTSGHEDATRQVEAVRESLGRTANALEAVVKSFNEETGTKFADAMETFSAASETYKTVGEELQTFTSDGVTPVAQQLSQLADSLEKHQQILALFNSLSEPRLRQEVEQFTKDLATVKETTAAIQALPVQLEQLLSELVRTQLDRDRSNRGLLGGLGSWFGGGSNGRSH